MTGMEAVFVTLALDETEPGKDAMVVTQEQMAIMSRDVDIHVAVAD